jgi:hypothetical protein
VALADEYIGEFRRLSDLLDRGLDVLRANATLYADAEMEYRHAKAKAWLQAPTSEERSKWTAAEREAWVNGETAALRRDRDQADGMRLAALESVRSRRAQLSALQSLLAANRAEVEFASTGPRYEP